MAGSGIMRIAYGIEVKDNDDPYIQTAEDVLKVVIRASNVGQYLVNLMPFCEWKFPRKESSLNISMF